ncbi:MAG TPA: acyltransferase [Steroidobacteraceae bacterium]|nr:acyltransferase [Steroidobacteraceae bacterium]
MPAARTAIDPRTWPYRYELLDGLRGLAALAVVGTHLGVSQLGHAAVMVFFVISGYCVAAAAESCRRKGLTVRQFMWRRLHRIYPPYFLSIVFYALTRVAKLAIVGRDSLLRPWTEWLQNLTLTQWVSLLRHPLDDAAGNHTLFVAAYWSLDYEEQFYLVVALALLLALRRRTPMVASILALSVISLAWNLAFPGTIRGIFIEYWVHFSLGATLFYVLCIFPQRSVRTIFVVAVAALFSYSLSQVLPWHAPLATAPHVWLDLAVASAFTLALFCGRPLSDLIARQPLWRPVAALGLISYSLYLVHQFNITLALTVASRIAPRDWHVARVGIEVAVMLLVAALFWYCCERPFLNRTLTVRTLPPVDAPAPAPLGALPPA